MLLRSFPSDATVAVQSGTGAVRPGEPVSAGDGWRRIALDRRDRSLVLSAPGYRSRHVHIGPGDGLRVEERLERDQGPLILKHEMPTGAAPKGVAFLPDGTIAVTELRGRGLSVYGPDGHRRQVEIPPGGAGGFVELAVLPGRGEVWVSQMNTNSIHVLGTAGLGYRGTVYSGGSWPKVILPSPDERRLYVANWEGRSVGVVDTASRTLIGVIPVGGTPRGLAVTNGGRFLWVCLFDSGAVDIVDTRALTVVDRIERGLGAARHIVPSGDGSLVYLSDMLRGTVEIIDAASRQTVRTRRVGRNVNTIALSPDGRFLYVSERGPNNPESYLLKGSEFGRLFVLDAGTLETVQEIWGRHQPTGLAVRGDGRMVAATDFLDDNVALYEVRGSSER